MVELDTCVFCELVARKRPISVIGETEDVLAFMDIQPVNPGHALVIPKRHAAYMADLADLRRLGRFERGKMLTSFDPTHAGLHYTGAGGAI
jgi:histidine triad (HIT) family protein